MEIYVRLLDFVNLKDDADKALFLIYAVSCLLPDIPHPLVIFHGEKGAAKSTSMRECCGMLLILQSGI